MTVAARRGRRMRRRCRRRSKASSVSDDGEDDRGGRVAPRRDCKDRKELEAAVEEAAATERKMIVEQVSCDFTKENFAAKPDLNAPGAGAEAEEEFCENCGKVMVLRNGPFGPFMACPGYNDDPPCKTIRKLTPEAAAEASGTAGRNLPEVRHAAAAAQRAVWRVHRVLRLSEVQVREAEPD